MKSFIHLPAVVGAVGGVLTAAKVDFDAFRHWATFHDAVTYDWGKALWRWFQGGVIGAATGAGLTALTA